MARSHPPTLVTLTERALRDECGVERGARLLVAVSGGGDSVALLHVLSKLRQRWRFALFAHGVDHGLRPEAERELDLAAALSKKEGIPFSRSRVKLKPGGNLMARARDARYAALEAALDKTGADLLCTAHHADDRAETVLDRILRGSGPGGLSVLPGRSENRARPFIRARRTDVRAHLERHGLDFASDPSNLDRRFLRVRLRLEVIPLLEQLSPAVVDHLCSLADQIEGPGPPLLFYQFEPVALSRAQANQVRQLVEKRHVRGMVPLPGGRVVRIDPILGAPTVQRSEPHRPASKPKSAEKNSSSPLSKRRKVINSR
jgi:tRNA(Ile)-lysidine synthase